MPDALHPPPRRVSPCLTGPSAIWAEAAARAHTTAAPVLPAGRKLDMLLNRLDAAVSRGIERIDDAYYGAPVIAVTYDPAPEAAR